MLEPPREQSERKRRCHETLLAARQLQPSWAAAYRRCGRVKGQFSLTKLAYEAAISSGSREGRLRTMLNTPASTRGTGRNERAGMRRLIWNSHQGAHTVERSVDGGSTARFRATSHWRIRSARVRRRVGSSRSRPRMEVVCPKGTDPTTRNGALGRLNERKSATRTCTLE